MSIALTPGAAAAVRDLVASGAYPSPTAAASEAVALLRERAELKRLIQEGIDSGPGLTEEEVFARLEEELNRRVPGQAARI